jgi:chromosome segregation ATPase
LERQLKHKNEQINQLKYVFDEVLRINPIFSQRSLGLQQEINSAQDRCRVLRTELEDSRQSMGMAQKGMAEERRKLANDYEQRIKQLNKDLDDNKREILQIQEQATSERQKQEEINTRLISDLNSQIHDLQLKLSQSNKDTSSSSVQDSKQVSSFVDLF